MILLLAPKRQLWLESGLEPELRLGPPLGLFPGPELEQPEPELRLEPGPRPEHQPQLVPGPKPELGRLASTSLGQAVAAGLVASLVAAPRKILPNLVSTAVPKC